MKWQDGYDVKVSDFGMYTPSTPSRALHRDGIIAHIPVSGAGLSTQLQTGVGPQCGPLKYEGSSGSISSHTTLSTDIIHLPCVGRWMAPEALHPIDPKFSTKSVSSTFSFLFLKQVH
jgi:hypothetical protein